MAWRFVKQPNGLLARFSEVVDDFTDYDMSELEATEVTMSLYNCNETAALQKVAYGTNDAPIPGFIESSGRNDGLDRWRDAIEIIKRVHGEEVASDRISSMSKDSNQ